MRHFYFHPEAFREATVAASFYHQQQPGLEQRFLEELEDAITRLRRHPLRYRRETGEIRKCRLLRFPYGVIYRLQASGKIEILAIMHLRKQPRYWQLRL